MRNLSVLGTAAGLTLISGGLGINEYNGHGVMSGRYAMIGGQDRRPATICQTQTRMKGASKCQHVHPSRLVWQ